MSTLDKILQLLKEKKQSQKDLTDYLGLSKNTFTSWKADRNQSYLKYIDKIADFFNVTTDYLLLKTDERKPLRQGEEQESNFIKIAGRNGNFIYRKLSDKQVDLILRMIDQLPDAGDDL